jgi:Tol biopolymer transport system component
MRDSANIYRYDFAAKRVIQVTKLQGEFARSFSISPNSRSIVFERCSTYEDEKGCDLWITEMDGGKPRLLVKNGLRPAWGR